MKKPQSNGLIDKGIPLPPKGERGAPLKYPWEQMNIGDSIVITSKTKSPQQWANLKYAPKHWIARKTPGGLRVWRDK